MRIRIGSAALLFAVAAAGAAPAFGQFEGVADFKVTMGEKGRAANGTGKVYVARAGYRSEWQTELNLSGQRRDGAMPQRIKMTLVGQRGEPDKLYMIDDDAKTYSVMDLKKMRDEARSQSKETYTVQRLGRDSVAGLACEKAAVTSSKGDVFDVCVSRELGASSDWISAMSHRGGTGFWFGALRENGLEGFPVRWSTRRKGDTEPSMVMEVTHVERKSLPASLFQVPAGYKQTESALGGLTPEQQKALNDARAQMKDALDKMTPEQRKAYEDAMKRYGAPTPVP
jgi:Domain of unknown function (DUF4412)